MPLENDEFDKLLDDIDAEEDDFGFETIVFEVILEMPYDTFTKLSRIRKSRSYWTEDDDPLHDLLANRIYNYDPDIDRFKAIKNENDITTAKMTGSFEPIYDMLNIEPSEALENADLPQTGQQIETDYGIIKIVNSSFKIKAIQPGPEIDFRP